MRLDHGGRQCESAGLVRLDEHALPAGIVDHVPVGHPIGHRDHYFVAGVDQRLGQVEDDVFAAHRDEALLRLVAGAEIPRMALADGLPQLRGSGGSRVLGEIPV